MAPIHEQEKEGAVNIREFGLDCAILSSFPVTFQLNIIRQKTME